MIKVKILINQIYTLLYIFIYFYDAEIIKLLVFQIVYQNL
jgi:hypothetical protein